MTTVVRTMPRPTAPKTSKRPGREVSNRKYARPVMRILDRNTRKVVGWMYEWNTGARVPMWKAGVCEDVIYD